MFPGDLDLSSLELSSRISSFAMPAGWDQGQFPPPILVFHSFGAELHGADEDFHASLDDFAGTERDAVASYDAGSAGLIKPQRR